MEEKKEIFRMVTPTDDEFEQRRELAKKLLRSLFRKTGGAGGSVAVVEMMAASMIGALGEMTGSDPLRLVEAFAFNVRSLLINMKSNNKK